MQLKRVIPSILLSGDGLYKTIKYKNRKYVGDPINTIKLFNDLMVDELILIDIDASRQSSGPNFEVIESIASECFMPLCYGGGISCLNDVDKVLSLGVEKISINSAALANLNLVTEISNKFGSQSVVVAIDVKKNFFGKKVIFSHLGKKNAFLPLIDYVKKVADAGAGEILLNNVDNEGTMSGFDLELISLVSKAVDIPVVAHGGAGSLKHIVEAFNHGASAVCCGAKFIYEGRHRAVLINYLNEEEYTEINPF